MIATVGRMDQLHDKGRVETLIRSLARFSEKALLILSGKSDVKADSLTIGPTLFFQGLWEENCIKDVIRHLLAERKFEFDVERAIFLTVLHRLMTSGSDRHCDRWKGDYLIPGTENLDLHHLYRAMTFLGKSITEVLTRAGRYREVYPENADRNKPSPLKVKKIIHNGTRHIVCLNECQARKDTADRQAIIESLKNN